MSNKVLFVNHGNCKFFNNILNTLSSDGKAMTIKNKYFEINLEFERDHSVLKIPPAIIYISDCEHCDKVIPPLNQFPKSSLRLLLRICPPNEIPEISEELKDWEVDNYAEIININPDTFSTEVSQFFSGERSSLLDDSSLSGGRRLLEALEMTEWPLKITPGKTPTEIKIESMLSLIQQQDFDGNNFDKAFGIMMELKDLIPSLPSEDRHKYAAQIAIAFSQLLGGEEEDFNEEEDNKTESPKIEQKKERLFSDDDDAPANEPFVKFSDDDENK